MRRLYLLPVLAILALGVALGLMGHASGAASAFRWPWAGAEGWRYTQGFHVDHALDFQPQIAANCDDPVDTTHVIRPAAPGRVISIRYRGAPQPPEPVALVIDHGDGWSSYYEHLANIPSDVAVVGAEVGYDTDLGNPSCYSACDGGVGPPCATGRHVHFQLRKDGAGSGIMEVTICGYAVGDDSGVTHSGATYYPSKSGAAPVSNADCPSDAPPGTPTSTPSATRTAPPTATPTATLTSTPTSTATATATATRRPPNAGDAGCDGVVDPTDATLILQFSAQIINEVPCFGGADVNRDGSIGPVDAVLILQYVAGLIDGLGG